MEVGLVSAVTGRQRAEWGHTGTHSIRKEAALQRQVFTQAYYLFDPTNEKRQPDHKHIKVLKTTLHTCGEHTVLLLWHILVEHQPYLILAEQKLAGSHNRLFLWCTLT